MTKYRKDSRHYPILHMIPPSGTGIQFIRGRMQPFTVWNNGEIEQFCSTENEAFFALQDILDGYRVGFDWDDEDDDEEDF